MKHKKSFSLPASLSSSSSHARSSTSSHSRDSLALRGSGMLPACGSGMLPACGSVYFVELLAKSNFSFLQGASHPEEMVLRAKELGYLGLALVDVNGFYGSVRGYQATEKPSAFDTSALADFASSQSFQYIVGCELNPHDSSPLALLPMNKAGYSRLCRLVTQSKRPAPKGFSWLGLQQVLDNNEDLIAIPLPPWNEDDLKRLQEAFQDRIYLPVHKDFTWESVTLYEQALKLEAKLQIPLFATQRPLYHLSERKPLHDVLTCILHKTTLSEAKNKLLLNSERCLKPLNWIQHIWRERPDMVARTVEIAERIKFSLKELQYRYPREVLPPGKNSTEYLRELVEKGLPWRYPNGVPARAYELVEHELKLIAEMEYEDYFLTLWDICEFSKSKGILFQGRGSAANSVVCFTLGLTNIDPVEFGLMFERFISKRRAEPPDIDIDFEHERREEIIQYIYEKYGAKHAAMVCTTICYRSRMALREVAKVMGLDLKQIDDLKRFMGREGLVRLHESPAEVVKQGLSPRQAGLLIQLAAEMQGFPRHLGIHSGGFVIGRDPIVDLVPVEKATMDGRFVVQWNKDDINTLGMMKIDVLSLGMLSALRKCLDLLKKHEGIDMNLAQIPHDDKKTYAMIQKADTIGVFQIESRAQMSLLPRLKPAKFYDLVIEVAIVRPGPIQGGMVHPFLKRRFGLEKVTYAHPKLEAVLKKTMGVPIFQEQIMQIAVQVAGFTPDEADELRRIMSSAWTKGNIMHTLRRRVIDGMLANGIAQNYAEQIFRTIEGFSSYGFPESHSASFALLTYASSYLKCHYPHLFTCALLNSQPMGFYPPRQLISDAQRHGVPFYHLDVQHSDYEYKIEGKGVRVGFCAVFGLHAQFAHKLVEARERGGLFRDLPDFVKRTELPRVAVMRLAAAGALRGLQLEPRQALWETQSLDFDSESLFFGVSAQEEPSKKLITESAIPREDDWSSVQREYKAMGFSVCSHPLMVLRPQLHQKGLRYAKYEELDQYKDGHRIRVAGLLSLIQKPPTAKGMCFLSLEDETGIFSVLVVPQLYEKCRLTLLSSPLLEIEGRVEKKQGVCHIKAAVVHPLTLAPQSTMRQLGQ